MRGDLLVPGAGTAYTGSNGLSPWPFPPVRQHAFDCCLAVAERTPARSIRCNVRRKLQRVARDRSRHHRFGRFCAAVREAIPVAHCLRLTLRLVDVGPTANGTRLGTGSGFLLENPDPGMAQPEGKI
jgi:hypothetical protein